MYRIVLALLFGLAAEEATAQALLRGKLVATDSTPIRGATVQLTDSSGAKSYTALTDSTGTFSIRLAHPMQPGLFYVRSQMIGFRSLENVPVRIGDRESVTVTLVMDVAAIPLQPLRVATRARYRRGPLDDFLDRAERVKRFGGGRILDYQELQQRPHLQASHLLAESMPAMRSCRPSIFLDGMAVEPNELSSVRLGSLEGVEIYRTAAMVPVQYQRGSACGAMLFWTALDDHGKGSPLSWRRILTAGAMLAVGVLLLR